MNVQCRTTGSAVLLAAVLLAVSSGSSSSRAHAQTSTHGIVGAWALNKDRSDSLERDSDRDGQGQPSGGGTGQGRHGGGRSGMGRGRYGSGGSGGGGYQGSTDEQRRSREALREILQAPDRLTITESGSMVIMTGGDGRTNRLSADGKKVKDDSTHLERKTRWDGDKLVSEITGGQGGKITETYAVDPEHHQLLVTLHIERGGTANARDVHRVYEAAP